MKPVYTFRIYRKTDAKERAFVWFSDSRDSASEALSVCRAHVAILTPECQDEITNITITRYPQN